MVAIAFTLVSCSNQILPAATPTAQVTPLRIYATTATLPLVNAVTREYTRVQPTITFDVRSGNDGTSAAALAGGDALYLFTNHLPVDSPLWAAPIGQDGLAVIAHPANPITQLTTTELRDLYQGWIPNWRVLGGADTEVAVFSREAGSGTRAEFERLVMGDRRTTPSAQIAPSSAAMVQSVARTPGGIGYVSMSYLDETVTPMLINGVIPTPETVYTNRYPLRATLFVGGLREPPGAYRAFIGWLQGQEGQAIVGRHYAPLLRP
ncbi:MAG: hypothetical protein GYB67_04845 [Chloroflexi bacterium]|nr:hypothetical protein [Chloroflexota bacterium]